MKWKEVTFDCYEHRPGRPGRLGRPGSPGRPGPPVAPGRPSSPKNRSKSSGLTGITIPGGPFGPGLPEEEGMEIKERECWVCVWGAFNSHLQYFNPQRDLLPCCPGRPLNPEMPGSPG